MRADRRGDGAVERAGLENRNTRKRIVGSNPTLSANALTTPSPCPGATWSYGDVSPSGFPPIAEETTTNPGGRGAAREFGLRHPIPLAAPPGLPTPSRPSQVI